ncbi:MAG TPA: tetratricopeptide repeat protein [Candidatus Methylomirabilis sp.]|nr:tetratricopeptide repeat protein [Candidatus Methylomirabilis sp.]
MTSLSRRRVVLLAAMGLALGLGVAACASTWSRVGQQVRQNWNAQRSYGDGLDRYKARDYAGAIPLFQRALSLDPTLDDAASHLAWSYYHAGKYPDATHQFEQAILRQPKWEGLYDGLGWSQYQAGHADVAMKSFQQALEMDPTYRDAAVGLAYSLFELRRYAQALPHLDRLTREGEGNGLQKPAPDLDGVRSRLAWTLFYLGDYPRAKEQFMKGLASRPDWYGLHNGLGWSYLKLGDKARAQASFKRALELKPDLGDAKDGLSLASR